MDLRGEVVFEQGEEGELGRFEQEAVSEFVDEQLD